MLQNIVATPVNFSRNFASDVQQAQPQVASWAFYQTQLAKKRQLHKVDRERRTRWLQRRSGRAETRW